MKRPQFITAAGDNPLSIKRRKDVVIAEHFFRNERYWLIKDPLSMNFHHLNDEEHFLFQALDGQISYLELKDKFEQHYPAQRITIAQLQKFIASLHEKSLLQYLQGNNGQKLMERAEETAWNKKFSVLANLLSLKWRGVDPNRFLNAITPWVGWLFSPWVMLVMALYIGLSFMWLLMQWPVFTARLPLLNEFFQMDNLPLIVATILSLKVIHELAHGISFKRLGGDCHEIGVMFVFFIPTLYCSTTDAWLFKNKWQRILVAVAGMYIELIISATCVLIWWFTKPGFLNSLCFCIFAASTLSVVVLNSNPFLKLDGYYILSDLIEIPNLWERSGKLAQTWFHYLVFGLWEPCEGNSSRSTKITLVVYRILTFAMRLTMVVAIFYIFVYRFRPLGLQNLGALLGTLSLSLILLPALWSTYTYFQLPSRIDQVHMKNLTIAALVGSILLGVFFWLPLPHNVKCQFTTQLQNVARLYVKHDAVLQEIYVKPQQYLRQGDPIARFENPEVNLTILRLQSDIAEAEHELELLKNTRNSSSNLTARMTDLRNRLATDRSKLSELMIIQKGFQVLAPRAGYVIPMRKKTTTDLALQLDSWSGTTLSPENKGALMLAGQLLCEIGELQQLDAILVIEDADIDSVKADQTVTLLLDSLPGKKYAGLVQLVAKQNADELSSSLMTGSGGQIAAAQALNTQSSSQATPAAATPHFEARVPLDGLEMPLVSGMRGQANVSVGYNTMYDKMMRFINRYFVSAL